MSIESGDIAIDADAIVTAPREPAHDDDHSQPGVLALLGRTLLLGNEPYAFVRDAASPGQRGFVIILTIVGLVTLAQLIGYWLGELTAPNLNSLQGLLYSALVDLPWYAQQVQQDPAFAVQFAQGHTAAWEALRVLLGYPTVTATASSIVVTALATVINWLLFALLAHWVARWYGSQARFGQTLGVLSLAYAPLLLRLVEIVPGAVTPISLIFLLMLAAKFLALKSVHGLGAAPTLVVTLAPYAIVALLVVLILLNGGAYSLQQNPYVNQALQVQQFLAP